jgi:hypothetical protein
VLAVRNDLKMGKGKVAAQCRSWNTKSLNPNTQPLSPTDCSISSPFDFPHFCWSNSLFWFSGCRKEEINNKLYLHRNYASG